MSQPHPSNRPGLDDIEALFTYHPPSALQPHRYKEIRQAAKRFAAVLIDNCPDCADRLAAIRKLREAVMVANASIALEEIGRDTFSISPAPAD